MNTNPMENNLPVDHFLALPRPDVAIGHPLGVVDTTTLAAHDFDVDMRTGFMPPQPPLSRLPIQWESWELILEEAIHRKMQPGGKLGLLEPDATSSEAWRDRVRQVRSQAFTISPNNMDCPAVTNRSHR
jgi:indoleamine 2,3-dioxygenase